MDLKKTGPLIRSLRLEQRLTQKQLAEPLHLSDRTISKWERGPVFRMPDCSRSFPGSLRPRRAAPLRRAACQSKGRWKHETHPVLPLPPVREPADFDERSPHLLLRPQLIPLLPRKAEGEHFFQAERSDGEWHLTTAHPMEKEHFLTFAAWVDLGRIFLVRLYPEPNGFLRLPAFKGGALYFGCSRDGLFTEILPR